MGMQTMVEEELDLDNIDESLAAKAGQRAATTDSEVTLPGPDDDELEIEITDDTPEGDRGRQALAEDPEPTEEELAEYSEKVKKRVGKLQRAWHDQRRIAEQAEREREEAINVARVAMERLQQAEARAKQAGTHAMSSEKKEVEVALAAAKAQLKEATEAFDSDAMVEAQTALATLAFRKAQLDQAPAPQEVRDEPLAQPQQDVVQSRHQQMPAPDKRAQAWAERNKSWFMKDHQMTAFVHGVHQELIEKLVDPRLEPELYYKAIDDAVRKRFPEKFRAASAQTQRRPASVVAPVVRTTGGGKTVVTLTASQKSIAQRLGLTPEQYARQLLIDGGKQ